MSTTTPAPRSTASGGALAGGRLRLHGVDLEVLRGGSGPPVLLLHGPTTYEPNAPFLQRLAEHVEIVAPSHPGFGASGRPDDFDTVYDLVRLYEAVLDSLPHEKVTLIGCSFGGWLAAELAVTSSHRLARLILVDPVGIKVGGREERDIVHVFNTAPAELARRAWHDPARQQPGVLGLGWQLQLDAMSDQQIVVAARGWDALCLYAWRPHLYNPRLKQWLHRIRVPTLLLWGESDRIVSPDYGRAYGALIPGSRFETIPEAGHHPELECPEAFVERVIRFVKE
ncbi:MAG: alpha/beta hydrolase [Chloroflexota bacterium]